MLNRHSTRADDAGPTHLFCSASIVSVVHIYCLSITPLHHCFNGGKAPQCEETTSHRMLNSLIKNTAASSIYSMGSTRITIGTMSTQRKCLLTVLLYCVPPLIHSDSIMF